jgi:hypothetical protein
VLRRRPLSLPRHPLGDGCQLLVLKREYTVGVLDQLVQAQYTVVRGGDDVVVFRRKHRSGEAKYRGKLVFEQP